MLDMAAMRELLQKNGDARREARGCRASEGPAWVIGAAGVSDCRGGSDDGPLSVASCPDTALRVRLRDLANERRRFGYRRFFVLLRREGELTSNAILKGCAETKIEWHDIAPGKPMRDTVSSKASTAGCGTNF